MRSGCLIHAVVRTYGTVVLICLFHKQSKESGFKGAWFKAETAAEAASPFWDRFCVECSQLLPASSRLAVQRVFPDVSHNIEKR